MRSTPVFNNYRFGYPCSYLQSTSLGNPNATTWGFTGYNFVEGDPYNVYRNLNRYEIGCYYQEAYHDGSYNFPQIDDRVNRYYRFVRPMHDISMVFTLTVFGWIAELVDLYSVVSDNLSGTKFRVTLVQNADWDHETITWNNPPTIDNTDPHWEYDTANLATADQNQYRGVYKVAYRTQVLLQSTKLCYGVALTTKVDSTPPLLSGTYSRISMSFAGPGNAALAWPSNFWNTSLLPSLLLNTPLQTNWIPITGWVDFTREMPNAIQVIKRQQGSVTIDNFPSRSPATVTLPLATLTTATPHGLQRNAPISVVGVSSDLSYLSLHGASVDPLFTAAGGYANFDGGVVSGVVLDVPSSTTLRYHTGIYGPEITEGETACGGFVCPVGECGSQPFTPLSS